MRLFRNCLLSVALYALVFGLVLDRPLSLGLLRMEIQQKSDRLAAMPTPKLVILAGSNGPYSHSCAVIGAMLNLPCENAGIAVGIGLDFLTRRYGPSLRVGDIVYMPMEFAQYAMTRPENDAGPDGAILVRHDRDVMLSLPPDRVMAAVFSQNFPNFLESAIEMPMSRMISPARLLAAEYDAQGDRIGTTLQTAKPELLRDHAAAPPMFQPVYGATLIQNFIRAETARGVIVVGGLPTGFSTAPMDERAIAAIREFYLENGAKFAALPNLSRYPVADFYDSPDHLAQPCQFEHSIAVARMLGAVLGVRVAPPSRDVLALAGESRFRGNDEDVDCCLN
jgi:hypothetical protein